MNELQLYEDIELRKPVSLFTADRHEVGTILHRDYYLYNSSKDWPIGNISFENKDPDLSIDYSKTIGPNGLNKVSIDFKPPINRREKLQENIIINGVLLIG